jgi:hypothetical protein
MKGLYALAFLGAALYLSAALAWSERLGYTTSVSDRLTGRLASRFGSPARERINDWKSFAASASAPHVFPVGLTTVNAFFNRVPFIDDEPHWGREDYWATPSEMIASNGADCEDFSIAKYFMLKELGVPARQLRITYVTSTRLTQPHMVLAYYASPDAEPLILDNLETSVLPASRRPDLTPVYSFNDDEVFLPQRGSAGSATQIRKWRALLENLEQEARL